MIYYLVIVYFVLRFEENILGIFDFLIMNFFFVVIIVLFFFINLWKVDMFIVLMIVIELWWLCINVVKDLEIWRLVIFMEDYKLEIDDWDLGVGIYIFFYLLRSFL